MTDQVPMRRLDVYRTDDGRCIEHFVKVRDIPCKQPPGQENLDKDAEFSTETDLFIGVAQVMTNAGPKDLKFEVPAESIEHAFEKFHEFAIVAFEELRERHEQMIKEQEQAQNQGIVVPPAGALQEIDKAVNANRIIA